MFEEELALEKRESNIIPALLLLCLAGVIVGSIVYWVMQMRNALTPQQASAVLTDVITKQAPATLRFHTGSVTPSVNDTPTDPHYRLMEKAGLLKATKAKKGDTVKIALTPKGEEMLAALPDVKRKTESDGTVEMTVPLAHKKLAQVTAVKMNGPNIAIVEYAWNWDPTTMGDLFDANNDLFKSFNIWETQTLIQKYEANFYHGAPAKMAIKMVRGDNGKWRIAD